MSFFLRKAIRFGPIRFNLSKSGIGVSAGIKGLRIGTGPKGPYVHAGRGGIYYRKYFGRTAKPTSWREIAPAWATPQTLPQKPRSIPRWILLALFSVTAVTLMAWVGMSQTIVAIAANGLFILCVVVAIFERRAKALRPPQARWIDFDRAPDVSFLIAPTTATMKKYLSRAACDLEAHRPVNPATIEAIIGTVLLDWRGITRGGKPFEFNYENAKIF